MKISDLEKIRLLDTRNQLIFINKVMISSHPDYKHTVVYYLDENNNVVRLSFSGLNIVELPDGIFDFTNLVVLDAENIGLTRISEKIINLKKLTSLNLSFNKLIDFPIQINQLPSLKKVDLRNNRIVKLPKDIINITMSIHWGSSFDDNKYINYLDIENNPLIEPPIEIVKRGNKSIKDYFFSLEFDAERLFESKLIVVGQGAVGKTFLINRLIRDIIVEDEKSTEGIKITKWKFPLDISNDFTLNVWDFGGQEIYHSTHQFFLTRRSVYLLVWAARFDDDLSSFDYWLNIIKLLSNSSPVIIVQNKIDERVKDIDENSLKEKFPNIIGFHKVSAITGEGIEDLMKKIKTSVSNLEHIGDFLPKNWLDIRKKLENIRDNNYISFSEYNKYCENFELEKSHVNTLANYFHDLGLFLHFCDNKILKNTIFLNPDWATNAVYKLIDTRSIQTNHGKFNYYMLLDIWKDYPEEKFLSLIELMKKFELVFQIRDSDDYIIPELLQPNKPDFNWIFQRNLIIEYEYDFMPAGIITRLIVRLHDLIENDLYWKYGLIIKCFNTRSLIVANPLTKRLNIRVYGDNKSELLFIIRREIDIIHQSLNKPSVKELVPCICPECKDNQPEYYDFNVLKRLYFKGKKDVTCPKSAYDVSIENILGVFEDNIVSRDEEIMNILKQLLNTKDNMDTMLKKANSVLIAQPNFFGLGLNINKLIENVIKSHEKKRK